MEGLKWFVFILISLFSQISSQGGVNNLEMDSFEKDKILTCTELVNRKFNMDSKIIDEITSVFGEFRENANTKVSADMLSLCYNKVSDETVKSIFRDLSFYEFDWTDEIDNLVKVDYSKYKSAPDMNISAEQQLLFAKLEIAKNDFILINRQRQEKAAKSFPPIFGYDIMSVSPAFKLLYTVIVLALIAVVIFYALSKVQGKKQEKKKKKNKKD